MALAGRVAWVTGGGRGIGRACAVAFAVQGVSVAVTARSRNELAQTVRLCEAAGGRAVAVPCDVTQASRVARAYKAIVKEFGVPDFVVPAAGLAKSEAFVKTTPALMQEHWDLNVMGVFHVLQACVADMVKRKNGRIVTVSSVAGKAGAPYIAAYAASKHGLLGLTRSLAAELGHHGITVNAVCPGYVDTDMTKGNIQVIVKKTGMKPEEALEKIRQLNPQGRLIQPEEVAALVVNLCQDASKGINGQAITVDGGALQW